MSKKVFTTGEVASLLGVNINTVIKWFDKGVLSGFCLPTSNERRIPLAGLRAFMAKNKMPIELLLENTPMMRVHNRVTCNTSATISMINGETYGPYIGQMEDISEGGAKVSIRNQKSITMPVDHFDMSLEIDAPMLHGEQLSGELVHMRAEKGALLFGLRFTHEDDRLKDKLATFISSIPA